jgi:carbamoyl-phosphate synthase large subunit
MNILITSAGRRVSLVRAFKKELKKHFRDGRIYAADMKPDLSSACQVCDRFYAVPKATDKSYCDILIEICNRNNIKLVIPTIDTELIPLAENIKYFQNNGIELVISDLDVILMCLDKRRTLKYFDSLGFPRTKESDLENPEFPIFVKPFDGSSSIGTQLIKKGSQLTDELIANEKLMFLEYMSPEKYIEVTIDLYFDKHHFLKCAVPRERIEVRSGEVSKSVTRKNDLYETVCSKFAFCKGFRGCITLQVFRNRTTNEIFASEINPRFGGGYPLSYLAKANYPEMIIKEYMLNEDLSFFGDWIGNLLMLRYDDEIIVHDYKG